MLEAAPAAPQAAPLLLLCRVRVLCCQRLMLYTQYTRNGCTFLITADPFAQLEGLSVAPEPAAQPAVQSKPAGLGMIDLDALMGVPAAPAAVPSPAGMPGAMSGVVGFPPAVGSMAIPPMGGAGMPGYGMMPQPVMGGMVAQPVMGGMVQPMGGAPVMAPVLSAAAPPQPKAKPDPFADLFK